MYIVCMAFVIVPITNLSLELGTYNFLLNFNKYVNLSIHFVVV